jgi:hypothetical protein
MSKLKFCIPVIFFMLISVTSLSYAQPAKNALDEIAARGKLLAEYDAACSRGTDIVMKSKPELSLVKQFIARKIGNEWEVVFGMLNEKKDAFVVNYKYTNNLESAKEQKLPYDDTGFYFQSAVAIEKSLEAFNKENTYDRPFNVAVLPEGENYYVYVYPAATKKDIYPLGGDWRYLVSGKTSVILETRQLHKAIIEPDSPAPEGVQSSYHIAVLDEVPEDTDVLYVLMRKPSIPELIATKTYMYKIENDGKIEYLGLVKDILK